MPKENPLLSKNIPPAPPIIAAAPVMSSAAGEREKSTMIETPTGLTTKRPADELATIELSLYLKPAQDEKLEDLRRAYKRRTGKKISANEVMRRLIEHATLESLL